MIFHLVFFLASSVSAFPLPQGLTLEQFRQGARSFPGFGNEIKVVVSPSYRKVRRHGRNGRSQYIDTQDKTRQAPPSSQSVLPSARPVYINVLTKEDIEQKIREANSAFIKKQAEKEIKEELEEEIKDIKEDIQDLKEEIEETVEEEVLSVSDDFSPEIIEEEINMIEEMINENKMVQIVSDLINFEEATNIEAVDEIILDEKKNIKNIDGFDISLKNHRDTPSVIEIPLQSEIIIISDPIGEGSKPVKDLVEKFPISSIDFGLIQEV